MSITFTAAQSVDLPVVEQPIPIHHYLRQPQRLVNALVDPTRVEHLSEDCFRLKLRPLLFMNLSVQPVVDLKVWTEPDGTVQLKSIGCEIRGIQYINQRFNLHLVGRLSPRCVNGVTHLQGRADLQVSVELPPPLSFTPKPFLEAAGTGLLRSVLLTIKQRLMHQLLLDYQRWANAKINSPHSESASILSANSPAL